MSISSSDKKGAVASPLLVGIVVTVIAGSVGFGLAKRGNSSAASSVATAPPVGAASALPAPDASAPGASAPDMSLSDAPITAESVRAGAPAVENKTAAEKELTKRLALTQSRSTDPQAWVNLGDAMMQLTRERADPHNVSPAENAYRYALTLKPDQAEALTGMAWVTGNRHQFDQSTQWAKKAIAVRPDASAAYGLMGDAQVEQGDYDGAFDTYQKMLDIRPDLSSYSRGAHLLYITGDTRKAMWLMDKAVKSGGPFAENTAWCRAQLAEMMFSTGAVLPAESEVKAGLKIAPANPFLLVMDSRVKLARKDLPGAIASAEKVVAVAPQHVAGLILLYDLYRRSGNKAKADALQAQVETAAVHYKQHGNADQLFLAQFYADHDLKLADALQIVNEKTENGTKGLGSPKDADIAAWVFFKNGKRDAAEKYSKLARAKGGQDATRLYHAGMIAAKDGYAQEARVMLYKSLSINPNFDPLQATIAAQTLKTIGGKAAGDAANAGNQAR